MSSKNLSMKSTSILYCGYFPRHEEASCYLLCLEKKLTLISFFSVVVNTQKRKNRGNMYVNSDIRLCMHWILGPVFKPLSFIFSQFSKCLTILSPPICQHTHTIIQNKQSCTNVRKTQRHRDIQNTAIIHLRSSELKRRNINERICRLRPSGSGVVSCAKIKFRSVCFVTD